MTTVFPHNVLFFVSQGNKSELLFWVQARSMTEEPHAMIEFWMQGDPSTYNFGPEFEKLGSSSGKVDGTFNSYTKFTGYRVIVVSGKSDPKAQFHYIFKTKNGTKLCFNKTSINRRTHSKQDFPIHRDYLELDKMLTIWNSKSQNIHLVPNPTKPSEWPDEEMQTLDCEQPQTTQASNCQCTDSSYFKRKKKYICKACGKVKT
jgi:hypothetical protein